jgi:hypothetical protein
MGSSKVRGFSMNVAAGKEQAYKHLLNKLSVLRGNKDLD